MATTYYWQDAWNIVSRQVSRNVEAGSEAHLANIAMNQIWMRWDWKESLAELPPFYLIPYVQDYSAPLYNVPSDLHGLRKAYRTQVGGSPAFRVELKIINNLRKTYRQALPESIGITADLNGLDQWAIRVYPVVPGGIAAPTHMIEGDYKIRPVKITSANIQNTLLPFDDSYFAVHVAALKWAAMDAGGDPRAQQQFQLMNYMIDQMAENEGLNQGDSVIAPAENLFGVPDATGWTTPPFR